MHGHARLKRARRSNHPGRRLVLAFMAIMHLANADTLRTPVEAHRCQHPVVLVLLQVAPPPRSLGIYALPPLTHCDEEIEVEGQGFVGR